MKLIQFKLKGFITSIFCIITCFNFSEVNAQSIVLTGYNSSSPDGISFVAIRDIYANEKFYFSDEEYYTACSGFSSSIGSCTGHGEGLWVWEAPNSGVISRGTVIRIVESATNTFTTTGGGSTTRVTGSSSISITSSDAIVAFTSTNHSSLSNIVSNVDSIHSVLGLAGLTPLGNDPVASYSYCVTMLFSGLGGNAEYKPGSRSSSVTVSDFKNSSNWNFSGSNITLSTTSFTSPLPVEMLYFEGKASEDFTTLNWATSLEINNDKFEIQKRNKYGRFETIGSVKGKGNTNDISKYTFQDPSNTIEGSFYRLKQIDFDGKFEYSDIIKVVPGQAISKSFTIAPNPAKQNVNIKFGDNASNYKLKIFNLQGQLVQEFIGFDYKLQIDVKDLDHGVYFLQPIIDEVALKPQKLIVQ